MRLTIGFALLLVLVGCARTPTNIDFKDRAVYAGIPADLKYKEVGEVKAYDRSFVWATCEDLTANVANELLRKAKLLGGDAVIKVAWFDDYIEPTCSRRLGWFALFILPGFGPWVTHAQANGIAVRIER